MHFDDKIGISEIYYSCIDGGREYKNKSKGERPNQRLTDTNTLTANCNKFLERLSKGALST